MSKRYTVLGFSIVLALALAVPALGGPSNPIANISANAKKTANKAIKRANQAKKQAKRAIKQARNAQGTANQAGASAAGAGAAAAAAQTSADTAQATANGAQTSANSAQNTADAALAAAEAAEANAESKVSGVYYQFGEATEENTETPKFANALCSGDDEGTGGGHSVFGPGANEVTVVDSTPTLYGDGWFVEAEAIEGTPTWALQANVTCTEK